MFCCFLRQTNETQLTVAVCGILAWGYSPIISNVDKHVICIIIKSNSFFLPLSNMYAHIFLVPLTRNPGIIYNNSGDTEHPCFK